MSDAREDDDILLSEYLETPQSEWVHREIAGRPDSYKVDVALTRPEGGASLSLSWVGTDQKRSFRFDADRLILIRPAPESSNELIWER